MKKIMKPRICQIVLLADLSGSKRSMIEILKQLNGNEYSRFVISNGKGDLIRKLNSLGITSLSVPRLVRQIRPVQDIQAFINIYLFCKKYQFDVVHTHSSKTGFLGRIAARFAGVKVIIHHVRGYSFHEFSSFYDRFFYQLLEKFAGLFCDKVIFVNKEELICSVRKSIIPINKCTTILNGIDFQEFDILLKERWRKEKRIDLKLPEEGNVVIFCGRLCVQKDPVTLYRTILSYFERGERDTFFLILGDGEYFVELQNIFKLHSLLDNVYLLGWQRQIAKYLAASDVFFLPSLWEGMPRTILEAMSMGIPVVCSNIKGNREAVDDGVTGYLSPPRSHKIFAEKIYELIHNDKKRSQFGKNSYEKAKKYYDSKTNSRKIINMYSSLLDQKVRRYEVDSGFKKLRIINYT